MKILLADDEKSLRVTLTDDLEEAGHEVRAVADGDAALAALQEEEPDCVLTDLRMPGASGMEVLQAAVARELPVVVLTGAGSVATAVEAMKKGAYDYLEKPFLNEEVVLLIDRLAERQALRGEVDRLQQALEGRRGFAALLGESPAMQKVVARARAAARTEAGILIVGESGTGKEVLARAIHEESQRGAGPFVPIACGVLAESLLEDELFGHEKGAFTGAGERRRGRFEAASGGTVFLDDIDDMPLPTQVKLLRVLQERVIERLGGAERVPVDIRVIAASKVDLRELVADGRFREDLYYRLNVVTIKLPPLRRRREDIPLLVQHFLARHGGAGEPVVAPEALARLQEAQWPGNVRQLENAVVRGLALAPPGAETVSPRHLLSETTMLRRADLERAAEEQAPTPDAPAPRPLAEAVAAAERDAIDRALAATGGNRTRAAELLGISRKALWEKMKKLEM
jgi:DNA-binding NtrC family response regulator